MGCSGEDPIDKTTLDPPTDPVPPVTTEDDADGDGYVSDALGGDDCNDGDAGIFPGAQEQCDGIDQDCDGVVDNDPIDGTTFYVDADGDGYGLIKEQAIACEKGPNLTFVPGDCDDTDASIHPGADERCGGGDENCDQELDVGAVDTIAYYPDQDGDGYGNDLGVPTLACDVPPGRTDVLGDCDDTRAEVNPGVDERCDGADNDCDQLVDDADPGVVDQTLWQVDMDLDGFGDPNQTVLACQPFPGAVDVGGDCDDTDPNSFPGAAEVCDGGVDNDCDPTTDEAVVAENFGDGDGDGWGDPADVVLGCAPPPGYVPDGGDCDDADPQMYPTAPERCNGVDDDCDPTTPEIAMVGADAYLSVADAVTAALPGSTVSICDGTFSESGVQIDKDLTIEGISADRTLTTFDANDVPQSIFSVDQATVTLRSLTLRGSAATAVVATGGALIVEDCTLQDNTGTFGGAIRGVDVTVLGSDVSNNFAASTGGGIHVDPGGSLSIVQSQIRSNDALTAGGGFYAQSPTSLMGAVVEANGSSYGFLAGGGGMVVGAGFDVTLIDTQFVANSAYTGGGFRAEGVSVSADATTRFESNYAAFTGAGADQFSDDEDVSWTGGTFVDNATPIAGGGLAVSTFGTMGSATISNVTADGNAADLTGGGVYLDGDNVVWTDSLSIRNVSDYGAGSSFNQSLNTTMIVERVDFIDNVGIHGGLADVFDAKVMLTDCTVTRNQSTFAGGLYVPDNTLVELVTTDFGLGADVNLPDDVFFETLGGNASVLGLGAQATVVCDPVALTCQ